MIKQTDIKQLAHRAVTQVVSAVVRDLDYGAERAVRQAFTGDFLQNLEDQLVDQFRDVLEDCAVVQKERRARIEEAGGVECQLRTVQSYLPANYAARICSLTKPGEDPLNPEEEWVEVFGYDDHGWTLDGYVIPRLASGLIRAEEIK